MSSLKFTALLIIAVVTCSGQELESRFILLVGRFTQPYLNETSIHCAGTLISETHILCTASCVDVQSPVEIAIYIRTVSLVPPDDGNYSVSLITGVDNVFIHPFYDRNQYTNNAAIVTTTFLRLNPNFGFAPRSLGTLSTSSTLCNLFGWGGELLNPRRDAVMVNSLNSCDPTNPQNFCTIFDSISNATCDAMQGSPLTCGGDLTVAGFVTSDGGCSTNNGRTTLNYHSVHHFRDWIEGVIGPELPERVAVNFIVTIMERNETTVPRCFGTIISSNRVLTTASCVTIEPSSPFELLVRTRIVQGSSSSSLTLWISQIYIHPYYNQKNSLENNVAIIEIRGTFDQRIVPRTLGSLQSNGSCQLFGWGPTDIRFTRGDAIEVNEPQLCDPNHPQAFCTSHPTIFHYSCNAMTGSPVTCGGDESVIAGFLINNATCHTNNGRVSLSYHSVSEFTDWILNPANERNSSVTAGTSTAFVLFLVLLISLIN